MAINSSRNETGKLPFWFGMAVLLVSSCFATVEPAPYDIMSILLFVAYFGMGLTLPKRLLLPITLLSLVIMANFTSILLSDPNTYKPDYDLVAFSRYVSITIYLFLTFVMFASLVREYPRQFLSLFWNAYSVAGFIAALAAVYGYFSLGPGAEELTKNSRARGFFKDPNVLGPFLIPLILHHGFALLDKWRWPTVFRLAYWGVILLALLLAFSRGAWANTLLSTAIAITLLFVAQTQLIARVKLICIVLIGGLLVGVALVNLSSIPALEQMIERRTNLFNSYDVREGGRFDTQSQLAAEVFANPFGYGPNRSNLITKSAAHNVYIKVFAENGWLGGAAWLGFSLLTVCVGLTYCLRPSLFRRDMIIVYAAIVGIVAEGLIIDTLHWRHFFLLLGILWGLISLADDRTSAEAHSKAFELR